MASRTSFIHRDMLRAAALVWPAGGAADSGLEEELEKEEVVVEELKEVEDGKLLTRLMMRLSV